jgi:O-antigen ligase
LFKRYFQEIYFSAICFFFLSFWIPGHLCLSLSIFSLFVISLFHFELKLIFEDKKQNVIYFSILILYFISLISGIWGGFNQNYFQKVAMKSSLLFLPLAFLFLPSLKPNYIKWLKIVLVGLFYVISIFSILFFIFNYQTSINLLTHGKPIWLPFKHHIHYGVFILFVFIWNLVDVIKKIRIGNAIEKWDCLTIGYFIFYIHFISVRSAWLSFYLIVFFVWIYFFIMIQSKILYVLKSSLVLFLFAVLICQIPTIKTKINYTKWSLSQSTNDYSDIKRNNSIRQGFKLIKMNPFFGFGEGGVAKELKKMQHASDISNVILPHNQFIYSWASIGFFGFMFLLFLFSFLLYYGVKTKNYFLILYEIVLLVVFMVEPFLETQLGLALFLLPLLFIVKNTNYFKF